MKSNYILNQKVRFELMSIGLANHNEIERKYLNKYNVTEEQVNITFGYEFIVVG